MGRWWRLPANFQEISNRDPLNVGPVLPANPPWTCWWKGGQTVKQQAIYFQGSVGSWSDFPHFFSQDTTMGFQMLRVTVDFREVQFGICNILYITIYIKGDVISTTSMMDILRGHHTYAHIYTHIPQSPMYVIALKTTTVSSTVRKTQDWSLLVSEW